MPHAAPFDEFAPLRISRDARVFVLTGAGISAESGIRTFRDANGLWEEYRFEEVASPEGWRANAEVVWRFYSQRRAQAGTCEPNLAHHALAAVERVMGDRFFLCTQNVDDLHEKAGSTRLVHMHGELFKSRCERCGSPALPFEDREAHPGIPACTCGARLRPHIVWFGEVPFEMDRIASELGGVQRLRHDRKQRRGVPGGRFRVGSESAGAARRGRRDPGVRGTRGAGQRGCL